jgi:lysozyme
MFLFLLSLASSTLDGIDISSYQSDIDLTVVPVDFAIIKATEGVSYVNPYCDQHYWQAINTGKKVGVYHFARPDTGNSATDEADFFVQNCLGYIKTAILVLDWEEDDSNVGWAKEWLDRVLSQTGVHPLIYMSASVVTSYNWQSVASENYGLWVARWGYGTRDCPGPSGVNPPDISYWSFYAIWQWTDQGYYSGYGSPVDCDQFEGDRDAWDKYAQN